MYYFLGIILTPAFVTLPPSHTGNPYAGGEKSRNRKSTSPALQRTLLIITCSLMLGDAADYKDFPNIRFNQNTTNNIILAGHPGYS